MKYSNDKEIERKKLKWREASLRYYNKKKKNPEFMETRRKRRADFYNKTKDNPESIEKNRLYGSKSYYKNYEKRNSKQKERNKIAYAKDKKPDLARRKIQLEVASHRLVKPSELKCNRCPSKAKHYHHADYNKPLDVEPLCRRCHALEHLRK